MTHDEVSQSGNWDENRRPDNRSGHGLNSTELSAAHALLSLTPASTASAAKRSSNPYTSTQSRLVYGSNSPFVPMIPSDLPYVPPRSPPLARPRASRIKLLPSKFDLSVQPMPPTCQLVTSYDSASSLSDDETHPEQRDHISGGRHNRRLSVVSNCEPESSGYFLGTTTLALATDDDFLSPLHCFMRRYCVEVFTATEADIHEPRQHAGGSALCGRIQLGQVGIRCVHCKHRKSSLRRERAVCFPSSLKNIYHSIETWQRRHSLVCEDIPAWVKASMTELIQNSRSGAGGRRQYWEESARRIGLADTPHGVRFIRTPGEQVEEVTVNLGESDRVNFFAEQSHAPKHPVVRPSDSELVTPYLFLLLDQMETCQFSEEDRAGGRSKVKDCPVGYPGMQCKHCAGKAGFGRYFPTSLAALTSANSDRNIFNHIAKCRRCPRHIQDKLMQLRNENMQSKNKRGSRKLLFEKVWHRLHGETKLNE